MRPILQRTVVLLAALVPAALAVPPPELPRPVPAVNTFVLIVGKSGQPETSWDAEGEEVYATLGPGKIYVRLWYDGPCSQAVHTKHHGWRPFLWNSPLDDQNTAYKSTDRRMRMWNQENRVVTAEEKSVGNGADADLTPSGYAREAWDGMLEMARRNARAYLEARKRGERTWLLAGPNEFEYVFWNPEAFSADYSPFAVAEFRDWLTHRGEFAPGGRFAGQGRKGGEVFADDPSPAASRGGNPCFNAVFKTAFASWALLYWDLDQHPAALPLDTPGRPGPRERGHTVGGFDAPRQPGEPLWNRWQNRDPADPGYRQWRIHASLVAMFRAIREEGVPREEIWSRQRGMHSHTVDYWKGKPNAVLANWCALTPDSSAGYNVYNLRPAEVGPQMKAAADDARAAGALFGTLEWHPSLDPAYVAPEQSYFDHLEAWWSHGARVVGCRQWLGQNKGAAHGVAAGAMRIRGTGFDLAIKRFLATRPDRPCGAPPDQTYVPPAPRGLAFADGTLTWTDLLWDGESFSYGAWEGFKAFEVATAAELDGSGRPKAASALGTSKEARLSVRDGRAKRYLLVRGLARTGGAGPWSAPLEVAR